MQHLGRRLDLSLDCTVYDVSLRAFIPKRSLRWFTASHLPLLAAPPDPAQKICYARQQCTDSPDRAMYHASFRALVLKWLLRMCSSSASCQSYPASFPRHVSLLDTRFCSSSRFTCSPPLYWATCLFKEQQVASSWSNKCMVPQVSPIAILLQRTEHRIRRPAQ
jgi:hypothetical protein